MRSAPVVASRRPLISARSQLKGRHVRSGKPVCQAARQGQADAGVAASTRRSVLGAGALLFASSFLGASQQPAEAKAPSILKVLKGKEGERDVYTLTTGIKYAVDSTGHGDVPKPGDLVMVEVVGQLEDGTVFLDTRELGTPLAFQVGTSNRYITEGLAQVVEQMPRGSRTLAVVPPALGYESKPVELIQGKVPPNSSLYYEIELLRCQTFTIGLACCKDSEYPCIKMDPSLAAGGAAGSTMAPQQ